MAAWFLALAACGGSLPAPGTDIRPESFSIEPSTASLQTGQSIGFTALAAGAPTRSVTWSIRENSSGGAVSASGVYTAPAVAGTFHVVATSGADPSVSATATVTVTLPATVTVAISPRIATVVAGGTTTFSASVTGTSVAGVTWSVLEGASGGTVTQAGVYTGPATPGTYHVVATSTASATASDQAVVTVTSAGQAAFLGGMFLIGVYAPPPSDFDKWVSRGINTVVDVPDGNFPVADWDTAAKARGLKQIRGPMTNGDNKATPRPAADVGNTSLLAWAHIDEPNNFCQGAVSPSTILAEYQSWKAVDPTRTVFIGFSGGDIVDCPHDAAWSRDYATYISGTDWIANDRYPVSGYWDNGWPTLDLTRMTDPMDQISAWTSKPQFTYIESSRINQTDPAKGVSAAQLRAEIWLAVAHGARGVIYFPELVGNNGFAFDGTTAAVAAEMKVQNAILTALGPVLQGPIEPAGAGITVPSPLHATWRLDGTTSYLVVVNPTAAAVNGARMSVTGSGSATSASVYGESRTVPITAQVITDDFAAYTAHIYVVP